MNFLRNGSARHYLFLLLLLLVPVFIALLWGPYVEDTGYISIRYAQNLAAGRGLGFDAGLARLDFPHSSLTTGLLALFEPLAPMPHIALYLGALGWGVAAVIIYLTLRRYHSTVAILAAILLVFNPIVTYALAPPFFWAAAVGWLVITLAVQSKSGRSLAVASLLLLFIWFDLSVLLLIGLLLLWRWQSGRQIPWLGLSLVLGFSMLWAGYILLTFGWPTDLHSLVRPQELFRPLRRSELVWLFLPFLLLGLVVGVIGRYFPRARLLAENQRPFDPDLTLFASFLLAWILIAGLTGSALTPAIFTLSFSYLIALGLAWGREWLAIKTNSPAARYATWLVAGLLILLQLSLIWRGFQARPLERFELEDEIAQWLRQESDLDDILYASRRVGFLADRPTIPADPATRNPDQLAIFFQELSGSLPQYFVTKGSLEWLPLLNSGWFDESYEIAARFASDYAPQDVLTIWAYEKSSPASGHAKNTNVTIGDNVKLVAYQYDPEVIRPGDDVRLTLYLQATQPITVGFSTDLQLRYMQDGHVWAWEEHLTPRAVSGQHWGKNQIIEERLTLQIEDNIPLGAYELQALWGQPDVNPQRWLLFQDNDENPLDRLQLGYVVAPPPVDASSMEPIEASFGDQIRLSGIDVSGELAAGNDLVLSLFWEAIRIPDNRYTVFVHLFNDAGDLVASHDGEPVDGIYPTAAWQPGSVIQDTHRLSLPADLPAGEYDLRVGFYLLETGERLPVTAAGGEVLPDHALPLPSIKIGD